MAPKIVNVHQPVMRTGVVTLHDGTTRREEGFITNTEDAIRLIGQILHTYDPGGNWIHRNSAKNFSEFTQQKVDNIERVLRDYAGLFESERLGRTPSKIRKGDIVIHQLRDVLNGLRDHMLRESATVTPALQADANRFEQLVENADGALNRVAEFNLSKKPLGYSLLTTPNQRPYVGISKIKVYLAAVVLAFVGANGLRACVVDETSQGVDEVELSSPIQTSQAKTSEIKIPGESPLGQRTANGEQIDLDRLSQHLNSASSSRADSPGMDLGGF